MARKTGTAGNNVFHASPDADDYDGLTGFDIVSYALADTVEIDLMGPAANKGSAAGDTFRSIESFRLSIFNDRFFGDDATNYVNGGYGNDHIEGRGGNDALSGHHGFDTLYGGDGNDGLWGGSGNDWLVGDTGNDMLSGDSGHDSLFGAADNDNIHGGNGNDRISGGTDTGAVTSDGGGGNLEITHYYPSRGVTSLSLESVDEKGEMVSIDKWAPHAWWEGLTGVRYNSNSLVATLPDGDRLIVISNRGSSDLHFNVSNYLYQFQQEEGSRFREFETKTSTIFQAADHVLAGGKSVVINIGSAAESGLTVDTGWIFGGLSHVVTFAETGQTSIQVGLGTTHNGASLTGTSIAGFVAGDRLTGGAGSDTFLYSAGHGVDTITDFTKGVDVIDVDNAWFDGNAANGEFKAVDHTGGVVILVTDNSADGYMDNTAIKLQGMTAANVDASIFI